MSRKQPEEWIDTGRIRGLIDVSNDKIKYVFQEKEYDARPEEIVRAAIYVELVEEFKYSPHNIDFELQVPRRKPSDFADIVVFKDKRRKDNFIVVETKRMDITDTEFNQAIEQGFGNANSLRANYLIVDNYNTRQSYDIANYSPNERSKNRISNIPINYGLIPIYKYKRGSECDLQSVSFHTLASVLKKCHNILWSGGKLDPATAFDEMSKILFAKMQDEKNTPNGDCYKFQLGTNENEVIVAQRCISLYDEAREVDPNVFTDSISVMDDKIKSVVKLLEGVSLIETDLDSKGQAFEKFLGVVFRGELGQYFTRRQIVEFVVDMLEPNEHDIVLDPSCGSGGFLLYCMKKVSDKIRKDYAGNRSFVERKIYDFTKRGIFGIEINAKIARVAMMDMIVNEDGHTNIENNTGLNCEYENRNIRFGKFTLIMTNPPFGVKIKRDNKDNLGHNSFSNFTFGGENKQSQLSDILFLEQYKNFLTNDTSKNPRLGVVLQTGVLNNPSNKKVLKWIRLNFKILAVVSLPVYAFRKAGSGMKTSLLFLQKYHTPYRNIKDIRDYKVFFAIANKIGYDSTLRPDDNDLPSILSMFKRQEENQGKGVFLIPFSELDYRLDPVYYYNKFEVNRELERLRKMGHQIVTLKDMLLRMDSGKSPQGGVTRSTGEIPSITISNITRDGTLDFSSNLYFVPDVFYDEFAQTIGGLRHLDILIAKDGATTGKTSIVDDEFPFLDTDKSPHEPKAIFSEHIFRLRVKQCINPYYIHAFLNSELGQLQLDTVITGGAQGGITRAFPKNIFVPLISIEAQKKVADFWMKGINDATKLYNNYVDNVFDTKKQINRMIEETPL